MTTALHHKTTDSSIFSNLDRYDIGSDLIIKSIAFFNMSITVPKSVEGNVPLNVSSDN